MTFDAFKMELELRFKNEIDSCNLLLDIYPKDSVSAFYTAGWLDALNFCISALSELSDCFVVADDVDDYCLDMSDYVELDNHADQFDLNDGVDLDFLFDIRGNHDLL